jgi:N6-adenosine-specific RNA methylase IME4
MPHVGAYKMILADPPWEHDNYGQAKHGAAKSHYAELDLEDLKRMPVGELAHESGCLLLLWCTACQAAEGAHLELAKAWGFRLATRLFSWVKVSETCFACEHKWSEHEAPGVTDDAPGVCWHGSEARSACQCTGFVVRARRGPGSYSMQGVEDVWLGIKGEGWSRDRAERDVPEILFEPGAGHSTKPDRIQSRAERLWPEATPRLELFARRRLPGWSAWGNEAPESDPVFGSVIGNTWPKAESAKAWAAERSGLWRTTSSP